MASLKQTQYVKEAWGAEAKSSVYYIDIRAIDRFEDFYQKVQKDPTVNFLKSKVAKVTQDKSGDVILHGVDTEGYHRYENAHDLAVLAIGMQPSVAGVDIPADIVADSSGFIESSAAESGFFGAGCATNALDVNRAVQSSTAAALRAIQVINRVARAEA
jgi:quinone-modifying oxidoreductase subunit QmoA